MFDLSHALCGVSRSLSSDEESAGGVSPWSRSRDTRHLILKLRMKLVKEVMILKLRMKLVKEVIVSYGRHLIPKYSPDGIFPPAPVAASGSRDVSGPGRQVPPALLRHTRPHSPSSSHMSSHMLRLFLIVFHQSDSMRLVPFHSIILINSACELWVGPQTCVTPVRCTYTEGLVKYSLCVPAKLICCGHKRESRWAERRETAWVSEVMLLRRWRSISL